MKNLTSLYLPLLGLFGLLTGQAQTRCDQQPVDLVFVIDVTSSMREELVAVPLHFNHLSEQFSGSDLRTAGLVFRDYGEKFVFQTSPLSNETLTTLNFLTSFQAVGGGDDPEPLNETLSKLPTFSWRPKAVKLVFFLSDAPPRDPAQTEAVLSRLIDDRIQVMVFPPSTAKGEVVAWQEMVSAVTGGLLLERNDPDWAEGIKNLVCRREAAPGQEIFLSAVSIFPNPAKQNATITSPGDPLREVSVYDSLGKRIYAQSGITATAWSLEVGAWAPGVYWVKTGVGSEKLVVGE